MKKLIKKILTDKKVRNLKALTLFVLTVGVVGRPWQE